MSLIRYSYILTTIDDKWKKKKTQYKAQAQSLKDAVHGCRCKDGVGKISYVKVGGDIREEYLLKHNQTVALKVCILTVQSQGLASREEKEKTQ